MTLKTVKAGRAMNNEGKNGQKRVKPMRGNAGHGDAALLERREKIMRMYITGLSQYAIAAQLGMSQELVSYDIRSIKEMWRQRATESYQLRVDEQTERLNFLYAEACKVWMESREPVTITDKETGEVTVLQPAGNLEALDKAQKAVMNIAKLIGAVQGDTTNINLIPPGVTVVDWNSMWGKDEPKKIEAQIVDAPRQIESNGG